MQAHQLGVSAGRQGILVACSSCHSYKITRRRPALPNIAAIPPRLDKARLPLRKSLLPVAATLQENIVESSAGTKVVKVKLMLQKKCEFGQQFNVVGDDELFGAWNPEASIPMQWSEGHIWTTELELSAGKRVEFKVILTGDQGVLEWQPGPNRVLETSEALSSLVISESWSAEEHIIQNDAPGQGHVREMHGLDIEDLNEIATSQELLPDLPEDIMIPVTESEGVNEEERDKKVQVSTMPVELDAELPENQAADSALEDSFEDTETKPSVLEKDLKWGLKALSTLWGALVQKHSNEA